MLLAYILKDMGYTVSIVAFDSEQHALVGIPYPVEFSFRGTGWALVESTVPEIPNADKARDELYRPWLRTTPNIIPIAQGKAYGGINQEITDLQNCYTNSGCSMEVIYKYYGYNWQEDIAEIYGAT